MSGKQRAVLKLWNASLGFPKECIKTVCFCLFFPFSLLVFFVVCFVKGQTDITCFHLFSMRSYFLYLDNEMSFFFPLIHSRGGATISRWVLWGIWDLVVRRESFVFYHNFSIINWCNPNTDTKSSHIPCGEGKKGVNRFQDNLWHDTVTLIQFSVRIACHKCEPHSSFLFFYATRCTLKFANCKFPWQETASSSVQWLNFKE